MIVAAQAARARTAPGSSAGVPTMSTTFKYPMEQPAKGHSRSAQYRKCCDQHPKGFRNARIFRTNLGSRIQVCDLGGADIRSVKYWLRICLRVGWMGNYRCDPKRRGKKN